MDFRADLLVLFAALLDADLAPRACDNALPETDFVAAPERPLRSCFDALDATAGLVSLPGGFADLLADFAELLRFTAAIVVGRSFDVELGRRLRAFRARHGLTQADVAPVLEAGTASTVTQWERGARMPEGGRRQRVEALVAGRL